MNAPRALHAHPSPSFAFAPPALHAHPSRWVRSRPYVQRPNPAQRAGSVKLDVVAGDLYDARMRTSFCSGECFRKSLAFQAALPPEPAYMRGPQYVDQLFFRRACRTRT